MTWGYTFGYRQRAVVGRNDKGAVTLEVPRQMLERMGVEPNQEVMVTQAEDGSIIIRKLEAV